ncbi:unnamed protein product [Allacma fusca]|uniref:Uncharacterized protein n=1 Tax=Allacma fusca TaxID=39272 RepID=A0A8J2KUZ0_9HEXA|nr:unnamed protein product [Allacma fusca]
MAVALRSLLPLLISRSRESRGFVSVIIQYSSSSGRIPEAVGVDRFIRAYVTGFNFQLQGGLNNLGVKTSAKGSNAKIGNWINNNWAAEEGSAGLCDNGEEAEKSTGRNDFDQILFYSTR